MKKRPVQIGIFPMPDLNYPVWGGPSIQLPGAIPGSQISNMIADIGINQIPADEDYNQGDIRRIPLPKSPTQQIADSAALQGDQPIMGRGTGVGLMDMLVTSINQNRTQGIAGEGEA